VGNPSNDVVKWGSPANGKARGEKGQGKENRRGIGGTEKKGRKI